MQRLHCSSHLHYGSMGYTGYDPSIWKLCGWSWQPGGANYRKVHSPCTQRATPTPTLTLSRSAVPNPTPNPNPNPNPNPSPDQEHCAEKGAWPPFPFMNGALELLSAPLVRYVGTSPEVSARRK